ncbi:hypothetical protein KC131_09610 [Pseudomonas sp. JQ170]|uniref:hypothetical protein n=1 Tax=unclassified Pseudomonas TaxID=196821 RepID=UPI002650A757|nr:MULTISPECIES: hypothetical protein [unclassified Pseudomonas]MDN7140906.1 hypothetical protein [Pseudomonas sp. JQ170]WRO76190.1 hypothetical protein U9R80_00435 [Pseudomonas sp. 170C]
MNRHPATLVQISPLQLRQGLFFSLALLLTLIAGQLYHNWQVAQDARAIPARAALMVKAPTPASAVLTQAAPAAANAATVETRTPRERWVF